MFNNLRFLPPNPSNDASFAVATMLAYTAITDSALGNGVRDRASNIVQELDGSGRVVKRTYLFAEGAKIEDLLFYQGASTAPQFEIRGVYSDKSGIPMTIGGTYDTGAESRYKNARSLSYLRKANGAPTEITLTMMDGSVAVDRYNYANAADTNPIQIDYGMPTVPAVGYEIVFSTSTARQGETITIQYRFPPVHAACRLVPTVYGGSGTFSATFINVPANAPTASVTFTPTDTTAIYAIGTTNDAGLRNPGYKILQVGSFDYGFPPSPGTGGISPVPDTKYRERGARATVTLDAQRRPIAVLHTYSDLSTKLDRYRYASSGDSSPVEALFDTTNDAVFPGNVPYVVSGILPVYSLKLRELAVRAFSEIDAQGRAVSNKYWFGDGSTILDRYRYANATDADPTEALFDTTTSATFLNTPVAAPSTASNLGTRLREQAAGSYSTLDAQGRAVSTVYYFSGGVKVLDRYRYATVGDIDPTEILFDTTAGAGFPGVAVTETLAPLSEKFREQALRAYSVIDVQGRATSTYYAFSNGTAVLDRRSFAATTDSNFTEALFDTTSTAAFVGGGSGGSSANGYEIIVTDLIVGQANQIAIKAVGGAFTAGTIIVPAISGVTGTIAPTSVSVGGTLVSNFTFTPTAAGQATISATNNKSFVNPAPKQYSVISAKITWTTYGQATANGSVLKMPAIAEIGGYSQILPSNWQEIQFLCQPEYVNAGFKVILSENTSMDYNSVIAGQQKFAAEIGFNLDVRGAFNGGPSASYGSVSGQLEKVVSILRVGNDCKMRYSDDGLTGFTDIGTVTNTFTGNPQLRLKIYRPGAQDIAGTMNNATAVTFEPIIL